MRNVPGITMQAGEGGGASNTTGDMFNMRGFSANNSLFVDDVRDDGLVVARRLQPRADRGVLRPDGIGCRPHQRGRLHQPDDEVSGFPTRRTPAASAWAPASRCARRSTSISRSRSATPGTFLGNAAVRVNALWQDGGIAGRDYVERESKSIAPSIAFGLNTPTRLSVSGQIMRQDNLADYGLPAAASPVGPLTPTSALAASPVDQDTYYGSPDYDYDKVRQDNVMLRVEHDFAPGMTLRNQTRYNVATREAVITSIANPAAYNPATNLVTLSRQANERRNEIFSNQTSLTARLATGAHPARAERRPRDLEREPVRADARRRRHARAGRSEQPRRLQPGRRHGHRADRRAHRRQHGHGRRVRLRRLRSGEPRPRQRRYPRRALRHDVARGCRNRRGHRSRGRGHARQRQGRRRLSTERGRERVRVVRIVAHAARIRELPAERRGLEPEQPERRSAGVHELRSRHEVGSRVEQAAA